MTFWLSLKKFFKKHKYIILGTLFFFLTNYIFGCPYYDDMDIFKLIDNETQIILYNHVIYHYIFRFFFVFLVSFFLYRQERKIAQSINESNISERNSLGEKLKDSNPIVLIYKDSEKEMNKNLNKSPNIYIVITIMVLQRILEDIFYRSFLRGLDFWMLELPLIAYWNWKYLNFKIYRHHYLSLGINLIYCTLYKIIALIILIFYWKDSTNSNSNIIYYKYNKNKWLILLGIIFYLIIMIPRAYAITKIKVFMDLKYASPYKLLIIYGILGTIISAIIGTISTFVKCYKIENFEINICNIDKDKKEDYLENFYLYWKAQEKTKDIIIELFLFIFGIISNSFYAIFYMLIIKNLTPMHIYFLNLLYLYLFKLLAFAINLIRKYDEYKSKDKILLIFFILELLNIVIVFFGLLVFFEILKLKFCNLDYDLREKIVERSINDYNSGKETNLFEKDNDKEDEYN